MTQKKISVFFIIVVILLFPRLIADAQVATSQKLDVVVIDAGHGGKDSGAVGKMSYEKDIVLSVALKVGALIEKNYKDVKVIYTRKTDNFVELNERANIANRSNADLFISIHVNSVDGNNSSHGAETFVMGLHKNAANLDVAKRENAVILKEDNYQSKYEGFDPNDMENNIIFSLYQNAYLTQSLSLAAFIQNNFTKTLNRFDRGVKQAGFLVLWKTAMPSVLVELGFISNPEEEQYLNTKSGQTELSTSIYNAFAKYKSEYDNSEVKLENVTVKTSAGESPQKIVNQDEPKNPELSTPSEILFKIQVKTSDKKLELNEANFKSYVDKVGFYVQKGVYKYTIGAEKSYDEILKLYKTIKPEFEGCFVIALKDGERMNLNEAISATKN